VVYGDIGTSPLYALREAFHGTHGIAVTPATCWRAVPRVLSLVIVVTIKYHIVIISGRQQG